MTEASEKEIRVQKENPSDFVCLPDAGGVRLSRLFLG